jgi:hypothetical protein
MKFITLLWIAALLFGLIGFFGKIIKKESFKLNKEDSIFSRMFGFGTIMIYVFIFSLITKYSYKKDFTDSEREKYHIPCISNSMKLSARTKTKEIWRNTISLKEDSIQHIEKIIHLDIIDVYKETDRFVNLHENKTLILETIFPGPLRKHKTKYQILNGIYLIDNYKYSEMTLITSQQVDSILGKWKFINEFDCYLDNK